MGVLIGKGGIYGQVTIPLLWSLPAVGFCRGGCGKRRWATLALHGEHSWWLDLLFPCFEDLSGACFNVCFLPSFQICPLFYSSCHFRPSGSNRQCASRWTMQISLWQFLTRQFTTAWKEKWNELLESMDHFARFAFQQKDFFFCEPIIRTHLRRAFSVQSHLPHLTGKIS